MAMQTAGVLMKTPGFFLNVIELKSRLFLKMFFSYQKKFENFTENNYKY